MRCVALLRGINVSGRKTVTMTDLRKAFEALGFENVKIYGNSGNIIFDCAGDETTKLATRIEETLSETFEFSTNVIIRTQQELKRVIETNPLVEGADVAYDKLYVTFLADVPDETVVESLTLNRTRTRSSRLFAPKYISIARTDMLGQN